MIITHSEKTVVMGAEHKDDQVSEITVTTPDGETVTYEATDFILVGVTPDGKGLQSVGMISDNMINHLLVMAQARRLSDSLMTHQKEHAPKSAKGEN